MKFIVTIPSLQYMLAFPSVSSRNPMPAIVRPSKIPLPSNTHLGSLIDLDIRGQSKRVETSIVAAVLDCVARLHSGQSERQGGSGASSRSNSESKCDVLGVLGGVGGAVLF